VTGQRSYMVRHENAHIVAHHTWCWNAGPTRGGTRGSLYPGPVSTGARERVRMISFSVIKPKIIISVRKLPV